jgi:hypothetical protein
VTFLERDLRDGLEGAVEPRDSVIEAPLMLATLCVRQEVEHVMTARRLRNPVARDADKLSTTPASTRSPSRGAERGAQIIRRPC